MSRHPKYRTKICRNFALGQCKRGDKCTFIHPSPILFPPFGSMSPFASQLILSWPMLAPQMPPGASAPSPSPELMPLVFPSLNDRTNSTPIKEAQSLLFSAPSVDEPPISSFRPVTYKTKHCRHFGRKNGWCPRGDECNFIHDVALLQPRDDLGSMEQAAPPAIELSTRTISGGVRIASPPAGHCWSYVQGVCRDPACQYVHPADISPYIRYTPCGEWPNCERGPYCTFQHPVSVAPLAPVPIPVYSPPPVIASHLSHLGAAMPIPEIACPSRLASGTSQASVLPYGAYEINGTTYYPPQVLNPQFPYGQSAPESYPQQDQTPIYPQPDLYDQSWIPQCPSTDDVFTTNDGVVADGQWVPPPTTPVETHPEIEVASTDSTLEAEAARLTSTQDDEFPYRPPKNQRVGHARRVSVSMKKLDGINARL
ncbi:hypothetical protein BV22DRAFT_1192932 [Leucogyrophana mollusca]|uniref:Uncharacterized protein n=1 Tax=Leucogyrophana mollusca TaxID=85980 RepID=A0ACB8BSL8_9AGAM|nr:hypothetical protein BV22DRAFT_1192932 [Leucogyrophana mollusca]